MEHGVSQIVDLDGAWSSGSLPEARYLDCRPWGKQLRYCAPARLIQAFQAEVWPSLTPFSLLGSGDFHHLSGLWVRQMTAPFVLISFDNHPDWDTRPPYWCCGTWMNRALEFSLLQRAAVWGCANFELNPPHRWFANHRALRSGRLEVWPCSERFGRPAQKRWPGIRASNWREQFSRFARSLSGSPVYITIDLDCLTAEEAATDWEQGLFTAPDIAWALREVWHSTKVAAGDLCGAHSQQEYLRWTQRTNARMDHPKKPETDFHDVRMRNRRALETIWPALVGPGI